MAVNYLASLALVIAIIASSPAYSGEQEVDTLSVEDRISLLERRQRDIEARSQANAFAVEQLTQALRETRSAVQNNADVIERIVARLARGDDPIVALEVENLWRRLRALEEELGAMIEASSTAATE